MEKKQSKLLFHSLDRTDPFAILSGEQRKTSATFLTFTHRTERNFNGMANTKRWARIVELSIKSRAEWPVSCLHCTEANNCRKTSIKSGSRPMSIFSLEQYLLTCDPFYKLILHHCRRRAASTSIERSSAIDHHQHDHHYNGSLVAAIVNAGHYLSLA